ncbi:hypothetical protein C9J85_05130 [Haloferax sp. wsp5]|uniref:Uncharacterized protein n=1 Tax=Haloarcula marismortui (strain ATCC 43049 / DSM 3752 / JCM 8966 / VKM B-1809) TaxID=272569 RepID=Q5V3C8_HALMA|nr:hypothetical protein [Haloarcula marismortui]AAV45974.1 unknown [Haloarcula marismortui ATCC 43049]QCP90743.1 hypothetical protein E6P14_07640 [Haloarcula marismortui ATCC 43049]TQR22140.1 hypothetical protein C9J85_05130 [Haloferax sp. wsp5]
MAVESPDKQAESPTTSGPARFSERYLQVEMPGEEGPDGQQHYPSHTDGCYYDRVESCCTFCYLRKTFDAF